MHIKSDDKHFYVSYYMYYKCFFVFMACDRKRITF